MFFLTNNWFPNFQLFMSLNRLLKSIIQE